MYFVDRNKITKNLQYLDGLLAILESENSWLENDIKELAIERIGHNVMESMMDVGNLMIDGFIMRDPGSYEDIIDILIDEKVVSTEMEEPLKAVVGLRKMLVREFTDVDVQGVVNVLTATLPALKQFSPAVNSYLTNELGPVSAFLPEDHQ
ncbi:hypothetical protein B1B04_10890 [Lysinibacillus sp. KCTC 33748]|uniref:DUF86 domain-containing protein n=1 Tax=unclassified Lysinibacillus TaxID=2636778 RepID=UPI0009A60C6D|nr:MULTISPECIES: DUF86 domain-containing protein [unclassified Lysinibacillus]OXS74107.1 hypothetical protein B1B04_10890 [Lysinibacillus sp. KCTC 33748]SKB71014.1 Uncharacterized conserved protein YutE, UPF0331/DUF86 family [Lysinibacillus sp. AC-3]